MRYDRLGFFFCMALAACAQETPDAPAQIASDVPSADEAPYAPVNENGAPTVASLEADGYARADYFPVGCTIPDQPDASCDATGAEFMDQPGATYENYDQYEYVCPAIDGVELSDWKCRKQEMSNG